MKGVRVTREGDYVVCGSRELSSVLAETLRLEHELSRARAETEVELTRALATENETHRDRQLYISLCTLRANARVWKECITSLSAVATHGS